MFVQKIPQVRRIPQHLLLLKSPVLVDKNPCGKNHAIKPPIFRNGKDTTYKSGKIEGWFMKLLPP